jgi:putative transposase
MKHRRTIRLKRYDYRDGGIYFVTICASKREHIFGEIRHGVMGLNEWGCVVADELQKTPIIRPYVELGTWCVMPNHVHVLFYIDDDPRRRGMAGRGMARHAPTERQFGKPQPGSLPTIVGAFKSAVTKRINALRDAPGEPIWQRNYHEHIVRSQDERVRIERYILANPSHWMIDDDMMPSFL